MWYKEQERGQDKQTPSGIPLQTEPPLIPGTVLGHETTQPQLIPKGKTPDAGKARCLITEPLEPGEVLDSPIPTTRVESMAKPAVNHEITVTRPQVVPSLKQSLVSASTGHGRCLIAEPLEPGEIIDLPIRCLISDPLEQGEIIDLTEGAVSEPLHTTVSLLDRTEGIIQAQSKDIALIETISEETKQHLHFSFLQTSTIINGNVVLEEGELHDELNSINYDSTKKPPQILSEPILPVALGDPHDSDQPTAGRDSLDSQQHQDEATPLSPKQGISQSIKESRNSEGREHISFNIIPTDSASEPNSSNIISKDSSAGEKPSPNKNFKSPNIASPNGSLTPNRKKRKSSKSKLPPDSPNQPKIKSSFEARSRSLLRRSEDLLKNRSPSLKRPSPSPGKDKASKVSKVGEDKASSSNSKKLSLKT